MKLNHLNLTVSNVLEAHRFLEKHFGLKVLGGKPVKRWGSYLMTMGWFCRCFERRGAR
jgi:catechol 2,3-dioxygenase-like lactoylglutathione lyase family enzyme